MSTARSAPRVRGLLALVLAAALIVLALRFLALDPALPAAPEPAPIPSASVQDRPAPRVPDLELDAVAEPVAAVDGREPSAASGAYGADAREPVGSALPVVGVRLHGHVLLAGGGAIDAARCTLNLISADGGFLAGNVLPDRSWSLGPVAPGRWTLFAWAPAARPLQLELDLLPTESERRIDLAFVVEPQIPVNLALQPLAAILERIRRTPAFGSARAFDVVATRAAPERVLRPELVRAGGEPGLPRFLRLPDAARAHDPALLALVRMGPAGVSEVPALTPPPERIGVVGNEEHGTFHLSLCLGSAVLQTVPVDPATERVDFLVSLWDLDALCATVQLHVVDAERGLPLPTVPVSLLDANATMTTALTAPDGSARFESVLPGWYALTLRANGRADREERVFVAPGVANDLGTWRLELLTTIRGFVVDAAGRPVQAGVLARPLAAVEEQRFVRAGRGQSSAVDGTFTLGGLGRGPYVVLLAESALAARPVRVDTSHGDVLDVRLDAQRSAPVKIQLAEDLPQGTVVRLDTLAGLPVFAAVLQATREHVARVAPGRYRLTANLDGRAFVDEEVEIGAEGGALVVRPKSR